MGKDMIVSSTRSVMATNDAGPDRQPARLSALGEGPVGNRQVSAGALIRLEDQARRQGTWLHVPQQPAARGHRAVPNASEPRDYLPGVPKIKTRWDEEVVLSDRLCCRRLDALAVQGENDHGEAYLSSDDRMRPRRQEKQRLCSVAGREVRATAGDQNDAGGVQGGLHASSGARGNRGWDAFPLGELAAQGDGT